MYLTYEEKMTIDWNEFSIEDIYVLIDLGYITKDDIHYWYGDETWEVV
jgi:hypothetical protein